MSSGPHFGRGAGGGGGGPGFGGRGGGGGGFGGESPPVNPNNTSVFVGSLPRDGSITLQDMREAFVTAGARVADIVEVRGEQRWG